MSLGEADILQVLLRFRDLPTFRSSFPISISCRGSCNTVKQKIYKIRKLKILNGIILLQNFTLVFKCYNEYLVLGFLLTFEECHNSAPFYAIGAFVKNGSWDSFGVGGTIVAVLDVVFFEPCVWEGSPFVIFNCFDHGGDINVLVFVDHSNFLENARGISELALHLFLLLL